MRSEARARLPAVCPKPARRHFRARVAPAARRPRPQDAQVHHAISNSAGETKEAAGKHAAGRAAAGRAAAGRAAAGKHATNGAAAGKHAAKRRRRVQTAEEDIPQMVIGDAHSDQRFRAVSRLGSGAFGEVFAGVNLTSFQQVAIKIEQRRERQHYQLLQEAKTYALLSVSLGVPRIFWSGRVERDGASVAALVMERLGPSLQDLMDDHGGQLPRSTVSALGEQALLRLEFVHARGFVHRDVKPANFVVGAGGRRHILHIIDFGLARTFRSHTTGAHLPRAGRRRGGLAGTPRYASRHAHTAKMQSRRDDLESLGYMLAYLLTGSLPWQGVRGLTQASKMGAVLRLKCDVAPETYCGGFTGLERYLRQVRGFSFQQTPDYCALRKLLWEDGRVSVPAW